MIDQRRVVVTHDRDVLRAVEGGRADRCDRSDRHRIGVGEDRRRSRTSLG